MALESELLVDPETHEPVRRATEAELAELTRARSEGRVRRHDGGDVPAVAGAYVAATSGWFYPDVDGLASFLVDARLTLDPA